MPHDFDEAIAHEAPAFADAIRAVVTGKPETLRELLKTSPQLVAEHSRSEHRAQLLHYTTANAIEDELQCSPESIYNLLRQCGPSERDGLRQRALDVVQVLIDAGAEIDGLAGAYGGGNVQTPLNWLVSSGHPSVAGVLPELTNLFCQSGARVDGLDNDSSPVFTALGFGHPHAARVLFENGCTIDNILLAAASGEVDRVRQFFDGTELRPGKIARCETTWFKPPGALDELGQLALVFAAMCGHKEVVRYLIKCGVDKNAVPAGTHMTGGPLHTACLMGNREMVELLIELGADPTVVEPRYKGNAMGWAREGGDLQIVRLVGQYIPEFIRKRDGSSPAIKAFQEAVFSGQLGELQTALSEHQLTPEHLDGPWFHFDAPAVVCCKHDLARLDCLIEAGANINQKSLWWAGGFGVLDDTDEELAEELIKRGATVDVWSAASLGKLNLLQNILAEEPNLVHARGPDGKTPLHCARSVTVAVHLVSKGADLNSKCIDHESTPVQYLAKDCPDVARYLIQAGCETDIMVAAALGLQDVIRRLAGEDPKVLDWRIDRQFFPSEAAENILSWKLGWYLTPHQVAHQFGHEACVDLLFELSSPPTRLLNACLIGREDVLSTVSNQQTNLRALPQQDHCVLAHAARNNQIDVAERLLQNGLPVDAPGQHGGTALHWAAFHGNVGLARVVLGYHPNLTLRDNDYQCTPLEWAIEGCKNGWYKNEGDYVETVKVLIAAGSPLNSEWKPTGIDDVDRLILPHKRSSS